MGVVTNERVENAQSCVKCYRRMDALSGNGAVTGRLMLGVFTLGSWRRRCVDAVVVAVLGIVSWWSATMRMVVLLERRPTWSLSFWSCKAAQHYVFLSGHAKLHNTRFFSGHPKLHNARFFFLIMQLLAGIQGSYIGSCKAGTKFLFLVWHTKLFSWFMQGWHRAFLLGLTYNKAFLLVHTRLTQSFSSRSGTQGFSIGSCKAEQSFSFGSCN